MKKHLLLLVVGVLIVGLCGSVLAQEKRTRQYKPVFKHNHFEVFTGGETNTVLWHPDEYDSFVLDGLVVSVASPQTVTIEASDTMVKLYMQASDPIVVPIFWKGAADEQIILNTEVSDVSITLWGWEEDN